VPSVPDLSDEADQSLSELSHSLSAMASVVLGTETLDAVLDLVVSLAASTLPGVSGASVTLAGTRRLETRVATSEHIREIDARQYETGEGPCVFAQATGQTQHVTRAELALRWPAFAAATSEETFGSILSTPFGAAEGTSLGALNLYGESADAFEGSAARTARVFADHAGAMLANASALAEAEASNRHLLDALATRQLIGQAMGIIMARENCGSERAFDILRRASQRSNRKLRELAQEIVSNAESHDSEGA
jgi:hypothetical protein